MKRILVSIATATLLMGAPALAQGWGNSFSPGQARDARQNGDIVPLRDIFRRLERQYGGYQLSAELFSKSGGSEYRIEWMTEDGRRLRIRVDAQSGQVTQASGG